MPGRGGRARRDSTVKLVSWRLKAFLRLEEGDRPLGSLTRAAARALFERRRDEVKVDTLVGELTTVSRACRWFAAQGWLGADPCAGLVVSGERSAGKPQLRVDEARRFLAVALTEGVEGLAAAMGLLMGMRASEITGLTVRDVDDGGRLVWITRAKTRRGVRRLEVPAILVARLVELCKGKAPDAPLWGDVNRHWLYYHVPRIADVAGLPRVTPHGLRGTWATLAMSALPTEQVAAALGHRPEVTRTNYAAPGSEQSGQSARVATELGTPPDQKFPTGYTVPPADLN
jgi:integrase